MEPSFTASETMPEGRLRSSRASTRIRGAWCRVALRERRGARNHMSRLLRGCGLRSDDDGPLGAQTVRRGGAGPVGGLLGGKDPTGRLLLLCRPRPADRTRSPRGRTGRPAPVVEKTGSGYLLVSGIWTGLPPGTLHVSGVAFRSPYRSGRTFRYGSWSSP